MLRGANNSERQTMQVVIVILLVVIVLILLGVFLPALYVGAALIFSALTSPKFLIIAGVFVFLVICSAILQASKSR